MKTRVQQTSLFAMLSIPTAILPPPPANSTEPSLLAIPPLLRACLLPRPPPCSPPPPRIARLAPLVETCAGLPHQTRLHCGEIIPARERKQTASKFHRKRRTGVRHGMPCPKVVVSCTGGMTKLAAASSSTKL